MYENYNASAKSAIVQASQHVTYVSPDSFSTCDKESGHENTSKGSPESSPNVRRSSSEDSPKPAQKNSGSIGRAMASTAPRLARMYNPYARFTITIDIYAITHYTHVIERA